MILTPTNAIGQSNFVEPKVKDSFVFVFLPMVRVICKPKVVLERIMVLKTVESQENLLTN